MTKTPSHELATAEEWNRARLRETVLRSLLSQSSLSDTDIRLASKRMGVKRAYFLQTVCRPQAVPQDFNAASPRRWSAAGPWAGHANYAAAKGGLMLLMKSLAQEVAHLRIRVNSISPGAIRTPMNVEKQTSKEQFESILLKLIPSKRIGEPEDVAQSAVWLASDQSDYVHGSTVYVDGGMTLYPEFIDAG